MTSPNIAIIGHGFVGKAVEYGFSGHVKWIVDPIYEDGLTIEDLKDKGVDVTFVCVPTPMSDDGSIDSTIFDETMNYLIHNVGGMIVVKSTVTPDILSKYVSGSVAHRLVYNPEFLTEKNANEDFVNPTMHIFGGGDAYTERLEYIYNNYSLCKPCPVHHMSLTDASFVKYGINCFLASKVLWFNQFYDTVQNFGGNFNNIINGVISDNRVGGSHSRVPGFDGKRGFGGACFPKDTKAFASFAKTFSVLEKVIEENNNYRAEYDKDERELAQNVNYD